MWIKDIISRVSRQRKSEDNASPADIKWRQKKRIFIIGVSFLAVLFLVGFVWDILGKKAKTEKKEEARVTYLTEKIAEQKDIVELSARVRALEEEKRQKEKELKDIIAQLKSGRIPKKFLEKKTPAKSRRVPSLREVVEERPKGGVKVLPPETKIKEKKIIKRPPPPPIITGATKRETLKTISPSSPLKTVSPASPSITIKVFTEETTLSAPEKLAKRRKEKTEEQKERPWLPSGSFVKGQLLSGLYAPTGGYAQANPHPVLIRVISPAILPGRERMDLSECFIIAAGYGDLASERAYLRVETLSCVQKRKTVIDMPIEGYVVGEDGKIGLRGRVVSRHGQMLAKSLISGLFAGFSDALRPQMPYYYYELGGERGEAAKMVWPRLSDIIASGGLAGVSKAMDRLADFYLQMAKQVFPVIEVDAGRIVEVVVLRGTDLKPEGRKAKMPEEGEEVKQTGYRPYGMEYYNTFMKGGIK